MAGLRGPVADDGMRLADLNPEFRNEDGGRLRGSLLYFDCPCGCGVRRGINFTTDLDGKEAHTKGWTRGGTEVVDLTVRPSIRAAEPGGCGWHGFLTEGEFTRTM